MQLNEEEKNISQNGGQGEKCVKYVVWIYQQVIYINLMPIKLLFAKHFKWKWKFTLKKNPILSCCKRKFQDRKKNILKMEFFMMKEKQEQYSKEEREKNCHLLRA